LRFREQNVPLAPLKGVRYKELLLEKTQKVLDRLIFVMFCEDGYLINSNTVKNTYQQARNTILPTPTKVWDFFKGLFLAIDKQPDN